MSIFKDSYQTTIGSVFVTKQIENAIRESFIRDSVHNQSLGVSSSGEYKPVFITGCFSSEMNIPLFTHPITILNYSGDSYLCTDLRMFIKKDTPINDIQSGIKNLTEFNFTKSRGILNLLWLNGSVNKLKNSLPFAGVVFSAWLSETISKAYALDYKDQLTLSIIASYYYQTLFIDSNEINEDTKQMIAVHTIKATKAPADYVFQVFDKIKTMSNINDFCTNAVEIVENVRLKNFNLPMLLTIIKNSWYGTNAKEIISVSIEHPPTWIAIVYAAMVERTFRSSSIYRMGEKFGKRGGSDEFIDSYVSLVQEVTSVSREELVVKEFN